MLSKGISHVRVGVGQSEGDVDEILQSHGEMWMDVCVTSSQSFHNRRAILVHEGEVVSRETGRTHDELEEVRIETDAQTAELVIRTGDGGRCHSEIFVLTGNS